MHALSKKLYYDVMKCSQEPTILESDSEGEYLEENTPSSTSDVGCSVRTHMKSNAAQTQWCRSGKNFRHEYTNTGDLNNYAMILKSPTSRVIAIHRSVSSENIAINRVRSVQTAAGLDPSTLQNSNKTVAVDFYGLETVNKSAGMPTYPKGIDECIGTECYKSDKCLGTYNCDDYDYMPCSKGLAGCRNFTLGTAEFRRFHNDNCRSKLIGGCRVPVCKI